MGDSCAQRREVGKDFLEVVRAITQRPEMLVPFWPPVRASGGLKPWVLFQQGGLQKAFDDESCEIHRAVGPRVVPSPNETVRIVEPAIGHGSELSRPQLSLLKNGSLFWHLYFETYGAGAGFTTEEFGLAASNDIRTRTLVPQMVPKGNQRGMLEREGVKFRKDGRVDMGRFTWEGHVRKER
jgi:hypothetical protein